MIQGIQFFLNKLLKIQLKVHAFLSNWCCNNKYDWNDIPVPTIQRTKNGLYDTDTIVSYAHKYYTSCGFLGMKKCTRYQWMYRSQ